MSYKLLEKRPGFMVKVVPMVIGCPGDGIKQLGEDIRDMFNEKEIFKIVGKLQKNVIWKSEFIV